MNLVREEKPSLGYIFAFLFGGKRYFPGLGGMRRDIRPFLMAAGGPYFRHGETPDGDTFTDVAAGGSIGGGFDIQPARWCMVETRIGYNFTSDFTMDATGTFGSKTSYDGYELSIGFGVLLGSGGPEPLAPRDAPATGTLFAARAR